MPARRPCARPARSRTLIAALLALAVLLLAPALAIREYAAWRAIAAGAGTLRDSLAFRVSGALWAGSALRVEYTSGRAWAPRGAPRDDAAPAGAAGCDSVACPWVR